MNSDTEPYIIYLAKKMANAAKHAGLTGAAVFAAPVIGESWESHLPYARLVFEIFEFESFTTAEMNEICEAECARIEAMTDEEIVAHTIASGRNFNTEAKNARMLMDNITASVFWCRPEFPYMLAEGES